MLHIPTKFDEDGKITEILIYSIKDLRKVIAYNSVVFDTRFKTGKISKRLIQILEDGLGIKKPRLPIYFCLCDISIVFY